MPKTLVGTPPDEPAEPNTEAVFLAAMSTKTDVEFVAAYIEASQKGLPWVHHTHVIRLLKLATVGLGDREE